MRARLDRTLAVVLHAGRSRRSILPVGVRGLQFQPDVERIHRAAGKEVADLARAHDHVHAHGRARLERRLRADRAAPPSCPLRG